MQIAYIGNFSQQHCTEVHLAATLESLGHSVVRLQEDQLQPSWPQELADDTTLLLYTRTWGNTVTMDHLAQLRERKIPSASYHLDLYVGLKREDGLDGDAFWHTDYVFTPDGDSASQAVFEAKGINHYYMKPGVFKDECRMATPNQDATGADRPLGVIFVGGGDRVGSPYVYGHPEWNYRNELITWLYDTYGELFHKFGHPQQTVRNSELNQLYANSKVVIGDSLCLGFDHPYYWSDRVYETMGRGGFIIHPYIKGMEEEFTDGKNIVFYEYNNWAQLKEKIDYYLTHDEEREAIRQAGHEFVKNNATYHDRLEQMLVTIFGTPVDKLTEIEGTLHASEDSIKINLGAGSEPTPGWLNVDWLPLPGIDVVQNLLITPWDTLKTNSADEIKAIDILEHMPNFTPDYKSTPIAFVEECHRILKTGGKLFITVPHWQSPNLWIDPTHVRGYDEKSMDYFDPDKDFGQWYGYYSDKKFRVSAVRTPNNNVEFTLIKR